MCHIPCIWTDDEALTDVLIIYFRIFFNLASVHNRKGFGRKSVLFFTIEITKINVFNFCFLSLHAFITAMHLVFF